MFELVHKAITSKPTAPFNAVARVRFRTWDDAGMPFESLAG